ncbi:MAG: cobyric acid synthase [Nitrospirae bacterium]|nr:cobyric acid synthase [Nitrospirota bacterium]
MTKALMIQGTGSGAGKSLFAAALCRIFRDKGINVAPFKAQNMALNSAITRDGGEMGRAQVLQAEAARVEPTTDMNPILLKASGEMGSQVIIHGKVHSAMKAQEYYAFRKTAWKAVTESFDRLSQLHELIILEGAGSPAEINLMDVDIVNMAAAKYARAPVLLIGDIDKGGVFASLYGTVKLLGRQSALIKGFVINKFRGDKEILNPGLDMIHKKTGKPVVGVLPYIYDIGLPEEDGLGLGHKSEAGNQMSETGQMKIVVVRLKYMSNFTDFDPFAYEPDVELLYSTNPAEIENADIVIVPGSKNTIKDLLLLKKRGIDANIKNAYAKGVQIIGMCGGYQMLGKKILDPNHVESSNEAVEGLGLLNIETAFGDKKTTCQVEAELIDGAVIGHNAEVSLFSRLPGYEIHMGQSSGDIGLFKLKRFNASADIFLDGSKNNNCWGTYIHGIFESDLFRRSIINMVRTQKGLSPVNAICSYSAIKEQALDSLAGIVKENVDMKFIERLAAL